MDEADFNQDLNEGLDILIYSNIKVGVKVIKTHSMHQLIAMKVITLVDDSRRRRTISHKM